MYCTQKGQGRGVGLAAGIAVAAAACSGGNGASTDAGGDAAADAGPDAVSLVAHDAWSPVDDQDDPLADHRPAEVDCPEEAVDIESLGEEPAYMVHTRLCNYHAASQPSLAGVPAGATMQARIWHFSLETPDGEPAEAHVAILADGDVIWEQAISIPAESQLLEPTWEAAAGYPEGTEIDYHLHNHGDNEWYLLDVAVLEP